MTTSLATRSTLLPSRDIRHALAGAAVELLVLVVREQAGARGGMWGVDHRFRSQVWWGVGLLWSTGARHRLDEVMGDEDRALSKSGDGWRYFHLFTQDLYSKCK